MDRLDGIYCGPPPLPADLWASWNFDPVLMAALTILAFVLRRSTAGLAAVAVLILAFVSPLCALSSALFSARVAHHVLLVAVAAPLLALARPAAGTPATGPVFLMATATLWLWHLPAAYDGALSNMGLYWLMQAMLLVSATLFWRAVLGSKMPAFLAMVWTLAAFMAMGLLGALLTFAPDGLYTAHAVAPYAWGLDPLTDQRLGGLMMWIPAGIPYLVIVGLLGRREWARPAGQVT